MTVTRRWWFITAGLVLVSAGAALGFAVRPRMGTLLSKMGVTAIRVTGGHEGLSLSIDGKRIGPLPQTVAVFIPGEYMIRVTGSDRYGALETRVAIQAGETADIGPIKLEVLRGLATIVAGPGAEGAHISIVGPDSRRDVPPLPIRMDIPTDEAFTLVATKAGYEHSIPLSFENGQAERTFTVSHVRPYTELQKPSRCDCPPGALICVMDCAANGYRATQAPVEVPSISGVVSDFTPSLRRNCWEPAFNRRDAHAPSSARVTVQVTIAPSGRVVNASNLGDPKGYPGLAQCIEGRVWLWVFPRSAKRTSVDIPFVFP